LLQTTYFIKLWIRK